jgi:hypothetical protein
MVIQRHKWHLLWIDTDKKARGGPFRVIWELCVLLALIDKPFSALASVIRIKRCLRKWSFCSDPCSQPKCLFLPSVENLCSTFFKHLTFSWGRGVCVWFQGISGCRGGDFPCFSSFLGWGVWEFICVWLNKMGCKIHIQGNFLYHSFLPVLTEALTSPVPHVKKANTHENLINGNW